jgi:hypothetical protein
MNKILIIVMAMAVVGSVAAAERAQKIAPDRLAHYWLLQSKSAATANVPLRGTSLDVPTCAAVAYTIGNDGRTRDVVLEKIVPEGDLAKVAVGVVKEMRFAATAQNIGKTSVRTYVAMPFNLPSADSTAAADRAVRAKALAPCQLDGYGEEPATQVVPIR